MSSELQVTSEVNHLKKVLVHSPDGGIGKVLPSKAQEWLYEDIVDLGKMQEEYDVFKQTLLCFADPTTLTKWFVKEHNDEQTNAKSIEWSELRRPDWKKPDNADFLKSDSVVEAQQVIADIMMEDSQRFEIVASICSIENCAFNVQKILLNVDSDRYGKIWKGTYDKGDYCRQLAKILLSGQLRYYKPGDSETTLEQVFPPVPNFIFTRDIGIMIGQYILLSKTAIRSRARESVLAKYMMIYYFFKDNPDRIIEINNDMEYLLGEEEHDEDTRITIEGGDLMMISKDHLLVGCSERTSRNAVDKIIKTLFALRDDEGKKVLNKISVLVIPKKRTMMHIDTIFTMIDTRTWVLYGPLSKLQGLKRSFSYRENFMDTLDKVKGEADELRIVRYNNAIKNEDGKERYDEDSTSFQSFEDLFTDVSVNDFGHHVDDLRFVYCGNPDVTGKVKDQNWDQITTDLYDGFPFNEREQWTDACNLVALKEGIAVGYDRNHETCKAFQLVGFKIVEAVKLLDRLKEEVIAGLENGLSGLELTTLLMDKRDELLEKETIILIPSAELSRARGGSHCMTMPLLRESMM